MRQKNHLATATVLCLGFSGFSPATAVNSGPIQVKAQPRAAFARFVTARAGSLDSSFGRGGQVTTALDPRIGPTAALQSDGKIIVADALGDNNIATTSSVSSGTCQTARATPGSVTAASCGRRFRTF